MFFKKFFFFLRKIEKIEKAAILRIEKSLENLEKGVTFLGNFKYFCKKRKQ